MKGVSAVSTEQNKAVVRRFITDVLSGGNLNLLDDLIAPNYVNLIGATDLASYKVALPGLVAVLPNRRFDIEDLVAEGDAVVARWSAEVTHATGQTLSTRGLTYYRLADGKIVEDDPITTPDLLQEIAKLSPVPATS
jgi:ketosteroid isomerase-like protein